MKIKPIFLGGVVVSLLSLFMPGGHLSGQARPRYSYLYNDTTPKPALIKQNMLSFGFFSPLNQHISFEYDRLMTDNMMLSVGAGIISPSLTQGNNNNTDPYAETTTLQGGGYGEVGVKLFLNPDYNWVGKRGYCVMQGMYIKPQLIVSMFSNSNTVYESPYIYPPAPTTIQNSYTGFAMFINLGGQWIIARTIVIDIYGGIGCNYTNGNPTAPAINNYYSYLTFSSNFPLAVAGGVNIGIPF